MNIAFRFLFLFLCIHVAVAAQPSGKQTILFSVNKKNVLADEFVYLYEKNHKGRHDEFTREKVDEYLDLYIKFKLKVEEARQRGMDTTAKFKKEFLGYKEALRKPYLPDNRLIDSLTQLTYNRMTEEVKAAHILIRLAPDASPADTVVAFNKISDIKKRIDAGEDFGTLAVSLSEDPSAKTNEGNLGYFTALQMVYAFESAAYATPVGQVGNPIRTRFGYHLIKVADKRKAIGEVEVSHILIRIGKDRDNEKAKKQIFDVYDRLQGGMKWDDLCKQYSEDQNSKDGGGKLRPFGVGAMASVPEFERTAFALQNPGDYSAPVATPYGWHIVKLEKKIPVPSYKEIEASLKSRVSRDERMQTAKESIQKNLRSKYAFVENAVTKKELMALADSSLHAAAWKKPAALTAATLFTLNNKNISVDVFAEYILANQKPNKLQPQSYLTQLYENFVNTQLEQVVEDELMRTNADYRYLNNEYYEGIMLFEIMETEIWNRASEDSIGQQQFFETNVTKYVAGERAEASIYSASKASALEPLQKLLDSDSIPSTEFIKKNGARLERGKFEKADRPVFSSISWAMGVSQAELDGNYYLVKIDRILPSGNRTFEEARGLLVSDYQTHLEKQWLTTLSKKYPVKVNKKGKKYVLGKLIKNN